MVEIPSIAHERNVSTSKWFSLDEHVTYTSRLPYTDRLDKALKTQLTDADPLRAARLRVLLLRLEILQGYNTALTGMEITEQVADLLGAPVRRDRSYMRTWCYDSGGWRVLARQRVPHGGRAEFD